MRKNVIEVNEKIMKWEMVKLGDIVTEIASGGRPRGGAVNEGVFSIGAEHLDGTGKFNFGNPKYIPLDYYDEIGKGKVQINDILIVKDGATTGKVSFVDEDFPFKDAGINEHVFRLCLDQKKADSKYCFYYLISKKGQKEILSDFRGATVGGISKGFLEKVIIPLPPLPTQKRIAEILDKADALRRKDQELVKKYDELAQAIFIDMFGDPVKNIKGWGVKKLSDLVHPNRIITYGIVQAGENIQDGIPYIRTGDIKNGKILTNQLLKTSHKIASSYKRSEVNKGDIIMSIRATVGTVALLPDELDGANLTQGTARISPGNLICRQFLYHYLKSDAAQNWISNNTKGATFREITLTKLRELPILTPDLNLQMRFEKQIFQLENETLLMQRTAQLSETLFHSLLQRAFHVDLN